MITVKKHRKFIIRCLIILILIIFILGYVFIEGINNIINLIIISFIFAYILKPIKNLFVKLARVKDSTASIIIILSILGLVISFIVLLIPTMFKEINNIGPTLDKLLIYLEDIVKKSKMGNSTFVMFLYDECRSKISSLTMSFSEGAVDYVITISENILSLAVIPVITYYFLSDSQKLMGKACMIIPIRKRSVAKKIISDIDKLLGRYIIGQLVLSLIVSATTFIALILLQVKFPIGLSLLNGLFNIIPYFGPVFGAVPTIFIALIDSPRKGLLVAIVVLIIQQIEGNILSPKITGDSTNIHPLNIIVLLLIGESFGGFIGMILAVPIGVIIKVIYEDINYYLF